MLIIGSTSIRQPHIQMPYDMVEDYKGFKSIILGDDDANITNPKFSSTIRMIRESKIPVLGIAKGFELIARAFGETVAQTPTQHHGITCVTRKHADPLLMGIKRFHIQEEYRWHLQKTTKLQTLATSIRGVEVFRHKKRPIYGMSFHPEQVLDGRGFKLIEHWNSL